ncbi:hypothetical protein MASR2M18_20220 [Ignavibacteria bacterium]|nr:hypothetical protein [Bacteroidota bacterium]MCZ2131828.1 hypothetical protein [Bacteroidota bacterium]
MLMQVISRKLIIAISLLTLAGTLSSCGFGTWVSALFGGKVTVNVSINPKVNQSSPIQTDILLIYDELLQKQLMTLTAKDWFEKREEIRANYPEGEGYDVWQYEWAPGQNVAPLQLPMKVKAVGGIVFANYFTAGPHRIPIDPYADISIIFQEKDFTIEPVK